MKKSRAAPVKEEPRGAPSSLRLPALLFALAALAVLIASLTVFKMSNNDIWIHLKTGENILHTWHVPDKDPYSFTASDHDYVAHEWLSGVLFYLVYAAAGVNGLIFFKAAIILATCVALLGACSYLGIRPAIMFPCFIGMLFVGSARFLERPHIFSYLFIALYLLCYFSYRRGDRNRLWLYVIPILHIPWTNLHGGHYQGIFLLIMLGAAEAVMYFRAHTLGLCVDDALPFRDVILVCALPFACLVTALINPYGYRLLTFPFELTGQDIFMRGIYEWQPAFYPSYNLSSMFLYYIPWTIVLFGTFLLIRGHKELKGALHDFAWAVNVILAFFWIVFSIELAQVYKASFSEIPTSLENQSTLWYGVVALFLLGNFHRLEFQHAGIVALFFAMSMKHNRAVTDAVIGTLPTLGHNIDCVVTRLTRGARLGVGWLEHALTAAMGVLMLALALFTFQNSYYFGFDPPSKRDMGLGIADNMPVGAVDYIERNHITGRAFPSYNAAAMLINRMWPEVKVAMDSRNDVYGETLYREYVTALRDGAALDAYIRKWDIDFFLITYGSDRSPGFFNYLDSSPDWVLVYFDDRSVVYLRNIPRFSSIIARDRYSLINPARAGTVQITAADGARWLAEARRAAAEAPGAWTPMHYEAKALLALNRLDEAREVTQNIIELMPNAFFAWSDLGYVYLLEGRQDLAENAFGRCLEIRPDFPPCREYFQRLRAPQ